MLCPSSMPILAVGALAVDAQFAFTDDALNVGERQAGKPRFEKAVDAHVVFVRRHDDGLDLGRQRRRRRRLRRLRRTARFGARGARRKSAAACCRGAAARPVGLRPRYGRAPFGRSPAGLARGLLTRRLMVVFGSRGGRWVAQKQRIVTAKSVQIGDESAMPGQTTRTQRRALKWHWRNRPWRCRGSGATTGVGRRPDA